MTGTIIFLIVTGAGMIGVGIWARLGRFRSLYLIKGVPGVYPSGYAYAGIPAGMGFLLLAVALLMPDRRLGGNLAGFGSWSIILLSVILMIWKPRWLKPWWLIWLEDYYGHVLEGILEEARNDKNFEQQTATEADLAEWADKVAERYGWRRGA